MRPRRQGRIPPGLGGAYRIEVVEVTGPPDSVTPMPPTKYRGPLIPAGNREEPFARPGPGEFLTQQRSRLPLIPAQDEIRAVPWWARVAFAARCARRVLPAVQHLWRDEPSHHLQAVEVAVRVAECAAITPAEGDEPARARDAVYTASDTRLRLAASADAAIAHAAAWAADSATSRAASDFTAFRAAQEAARVIFETATIDTPLTAQLRCIRRDFARLKRLAREQMWTDDTPVPPEVFGPLWPPGIAPYWAVEDPTPPSA